MANLADLAIGIGTDTDMSGIDEAEAGIEGLEDTTSSAASFIEDNFMKMGAAAAGIGAGLEGFARSQQDANVGFERMGRVTGDGAQAMRDMAGDLHNVTFPMEDVTALMETATKRGLEGEAIAEYATFWDMVGDATGESGPALAEAGVALGQVGIKAGEEQDALAALGHITDNTTSSTEAFLKFVGKVGSEMGDNSPSIDDMAGALSAMEDAGYDSALAQRELRSALSEADGDMGAALETLGISEDAYREQVEAVGASSGSIEANAQAYAESFTPMQEMSSKLEGLMTKYGGLASAAGSVSAPLTAVGTSMMGVSAVAPGLVKSIGSVIGKMGDMVGSAVSWAGNIVKSAGKAAAGFAKSAASMIAAGAKWVATQVVQAAKAVATMAVTAAKFVAHYATMAVASAVNAAKMAASWFVAMGPVGWVIAGIVALVALIIANWDKVVRFTKAMAEKVAGWFRSARDWVVGVATNLRDSVVGFFTSMRDRVVGIATAIRDRVIEFFTGLKDGALEKVEAMIDRVRQIKDDVLGFFSGAKDWLLDIGKDIVQGLVDGITAKIDAVKDAVGKVTGAIGRFLPGSPVKEGPLTVLNRGKAGNAIAEMLAGGMSDKVGKVASMSDRLAAAASPGVRVPSVHAGSVVGGDGASALGSRTTILQVDGREMARAVGEGMVGEIQLRAGGGWTSD